MHLVFFLLAAAFVIDALSKPDRELWQAEIKYDGKEVTFSAMHYVYAPMVAIWGLYLLGHWVGGLAYSLGV